MENLYEIDLVKGTFTPLEASTVLYPLLNSKINYHNLEIFSSQIRNDGDIENSKHRLAYLNQAADRIDTIIKSAVGSNKKFQIETKIILREIDNL